LTEAIFDYLSKHPKRTKIPVEIQEKIRKLIKEQIDLPSEYVDVVDKEFWSLLA
jgi:hypothetical protein